MSFMFQFHALRVVLDLSNSCSHEKGWKGIGRGRGRLGISLGESSLWKQPRVVGPSFLPLFFLVYVSEVSDQPYLMGSAVYYWIGIRETLYTYLVGSGKEIGALVRHFLNQDLPKLPDTLKLKRVSVSRDPASEPLILGLLDRMWKSSFPLALSFFHLFPGLLEFDLLPVHKRFHS